MPASLAVGDGADYAVAGSGDGGVCKVLTSVYECCFGLCLGSLCLGELVGGHLPLGFADDVLVEEHAFVLLGDLSGADSAACRVDVCEGLVNGGLVLHLVDGE